MTDETTLRGFRSVAGIYFKEGNDRFRACQQDVSKKILEVMAGTTELPGATFRSRASILYKEGNGSFRPCERERSKKFLEAMARDSVPFEMPRGMVVIQPTSNLQYNLQRMPVSSITGREETATVIEFPWDPKSLISIVGNEDKNLKRQLLMMALDRIRTRASLTKILTMKEVPVTCEIRENPYLVSGHPPYDKFIESLYNFLEVKTRSQRTDPQPTLFEKFLDCASEGATPDTFTTIERENIRMVFHGTNPAVMDAILCSGLQPESRLYSERDRDYFALKYEHALHYSRHKMLVPTHTYLVGGRKVPALLFMVINSAELPFKEEESWEESVSVHSNECELALAEITTTCHAIHGSFTYT